jgi:hypothetical protein
VAGSALVHAAGCAVLSLSVGLLQRVKWPCGSADVAAVVICPE